MFSTKWKDSLLLIATVTISQDKSPHDEILECSKCNRSWKTLKQVTGKGCWSCNIGAEVYAAIYSLGLRLDHKGRRPSMDEGMCAPPPASLLWIPRQFTSTIHGPTSAASLLQISLSCCRLPDLRYCPPPRYLAKPVKCCQVHGCTCLASKQDMCIDANHWPTVVPEYRWGAAPPTLIGRSGMSNC